MTDQESLAISLEEQAQNEEFRALAGLNPEDDADDDIEPYPWENFREGLR